MYNYTYEQLTENNLEDYISVFAQVFGYAPTEIEVKNKFCSKTSVKEYIAFLAYDENKKPVAYYGVFPIYYNLNDRNVLCAQSGSTMTISAHRGQGLFLKLATKTYELAALNGIEFVFGMPNDFSYPGLVALNWTFKYQMWGFNLFTPIAPLLFNRTKPSYFHSKNSDFEVQKFYFFNRLELNSEPAKKYLVTQPLRPLSFYNTKPGFLIERAGMALWLKFENRNTLSIGDVYFCSQKSRWRFINSIILLYLNCILKNISTIRFYCSPRYWLNRYFGFPWIKRKSLHFGYLNLQKLNQDNPAENLEICYGDYDTF